MWATTTACFLVEASSLTISLETTALSLSCVSVRSFCSSRSSAGFFSSGSCFSSLRHGTCQAERVHALPCTIVIHGTRTWLFRQDVSGHDNWTSRNIGI